MIKKRPARRPAAKGSKKLKGPARKIYDLEQPPPTDEPIEARYFGEGDPDNIDVPKADDGTWPTQDTPWRGGAEANRPDKEDELVDIVVGGLTAHRPTDLLLLALAHGLSVSQGVQLSRHDAELRLRAARSELAGLLQLSLLSYFVQLRISLGGCLSRLQASTLANADGALVWRGDHRAAVAGATTGDNATPSAATPRRDRAPDPERIHDPSTIVRTDGQQRLFCTGRGITLMRQAAAGKWSPEGRIFAEGQCPAWHEQIVPGNRGHLWAPDVLLMNQKYFLYYSVSTFGRNTSAIGLAVGTSVDPSSSEWQWEDRGPVIVDTAPEIG